MNIIKPPKLKKGGTIKVIAPSSYPTYPHMKVMEGVDYLRKLGFRVIIGDTIKRAMRKGYYSGPIEFRVKELNAAFRDDKVDAIFCARGGVGSLRILNYLDYDLIRDHPKIFVGYSDITPIQIALYQRIGLITFQGWMPGVYPSKPEDISAMEKSVDYLLNVICNGEYIELKNPSDAPVLQVLKSGRVSGRVIGGNLILFTLLIGTEFDPKTSNHILFLEDIKEEPWRIDNYLSSIELSNKFNELKGIILGEFPEPDKYLYPTPSITEVLIEHLSKYDFPIIMNFACCHGRYKLPIPIGGLVELNADELCLKYLENMVD